VLLSSASFFARTTNNPGGGQELAATKEIEALVAEFGRDQNFCKSILAEEINAI